MTDRPINPVKQVSIRSGNEMMADALRAFPVNHILSGRVGFLVRTRGNEKIPRFLVLLSESLGKI